MNTLLTQSIIQAIESTNFDTLFRRAFDNSEFMIEGNEENGYQSDSTRYAVMFNVETDELFFLNYATNDNGWANIAESQNPWVLVGYVSAIDVNDGMVEHYLTERMESVVCNNE